MRDGPEVFEAVKHIVLGGVRANLERQALSETSVAEMEETNKLAEKISGSERVSLSIMTTGISTYFKKFYKMSSAST